MPPGAHLSIPRVPVVRSSNVDGVAATMPLRASTAGGSGSFLVLADDGQRYWCKTLNNFQSTRVPITEQVVGRLASLVGAPACEVALVRVDAIAGWEFRPGSGRLVEAGWAHGSVAVDPAMETRMLEHRSDDDNRRRHCGIYALCDWLAGADIQWLYGVAEDNAYYSHDHGFYLTGPDWTETSLGVSREAPLPLSVPSAQLDHDEIIRLADVLEELERTAIDAELSRLPPGWPVTDHELDVLGEFVDHRRGSVAARLRALVA